VHTSIRCKYENNGEARAQRKRETPLKHVSNTFGENVQKTFQKRFWSATGAQEMFLERCLNEKRVLNVFPKRVKRVLNVFRDFAVLGPLH
jgi:hypothetical protein